INEMNKDVLSKYDVMTVGEMVNVPIEEALKYTGSERNELQMIFQWEHMSLDYDPIRGKWNNQKVNLRDLKESLFKWQEKLQGIG
ncbi:alpha-amylase family glycosyl hydrolase, partial [Micrococcus sp. SIMBA_131]